MPGLGEASWSEIEALRARLVEARPETVQEAAQELAALFATGFSTVVLMRVFLVVSFAQLPAEDAAFARDVVADDPRLGRETPVLSLLGTRGRSPEWNDRTRSSGHLAVPLLDRESVQEIPMLARLLVDLGVDLQVFGAGGPVATRRMIGGKSGMFYVPDARTGRDERGREIIHPGFAARYGVESVFGMGSAYLDGTLAIAILFCAERVEREVADRYGSFINAFKLATFELLAAGRIWSGQRARRWTAPQGT